MIRALLITTMAALLGYAACDAADPLNHQPQPTTTTQENPMSVTTRTVYRLRIQDVENGALLTEPTGPFCEAAEIAKSADLVIDPGEQLVLTQVLQRLGGDGCWHTTDVTITEVL